MHFHYNELRAALGRLFLRSDVRYGTFRTSRDVRLESAMRCRADIGEEHGGLFKGARSAGLRGARELGRPIAPVPIAPTPDDDRTVIVKRYRHWDD